MSRHIFLGALVAACLTPACFATAGALSPEEGFARANSLYAEENYEEALGIYERIMREGWEAPELYYNASNCYLRTGRPGLALVMCKRAAELAPTDEDVRANLDFIESLVREGAPKPRSSRLLDMILSPYKVLSTDGALLATSISWFALAVALSLRVLSLGPRRIALYAAAAAGCGVIVFASCFGAKLWADVHRTEAVIIVPSARVLSGPGDDFVVQTSLGEGAVVRVKRSGGQWVEVLLGPEMAGWVRRSNLEVI